MLLLLSAVAAAMLAMVWWIQQRELLPSFLALEHRQASADLHRGTEALQNEIQFVSDFVSDWSGWDDTYRFVSDRNAEFARSNLESGVFRDTSFDFLSMVGLDHVEVWRGAQVDGEPVEIPSLPSGTWPEDHPLLRPRDPQDAASGVIVTKHGPLLVASRPITDSERTAPIRGWILMGRFLDQKRIQKLRRQTQLDLDFAVVADLPASMGAELPPRGDATPQIVLGLDELHARTVLAGLRGSSDDLMVEMHAPRTILAHGQRAIGFAATATVLAVLVLFGVIGYVLQRSVVGPLQQLTRHALRIRGSGDLTRGSGIVRADELGVLAREFDAMVGQLGELQAAQIEQARAAGMAEVARGVLHDVGNALQPLQATVSALKQKADSRSVSDLERVADLLQAKSAGLARWITEDKQGQKLPSFLAVLAKALRGEHEAMSQEVDLLTKCIDHIQNLVDRQNAHRTAAGAKECVRPEALVAQALRMSAEAADDGVEVVPSVSLDSTLCLERHKLLAVLINLLRNARHASRALPADRRVVRFSVEAAEGERVRFVVEDQGVGIAAEDLTRIFQQRRSTSGHAQGQGLGLHACANRITEMGGRLWAESDGLGRGARFVVELPASAVAATSPGELVLAGGAS